MGKKLIKTRPGMVENTGRTQGMRNPQRCRKCETTQADLVAGVCKNCLDRCFTDTNIETDLDYGSWSTEMETVRSFGRVDDEKWKKIKLAAYDSGKSFSTWALDILLAEADKIEAKKAKKKTSKVS